MAALLCLLCYLGFVAVNDVDAVAHMCIVFGGKIIRYRYKSCVYRNPITTSHMRTINKSRRWAKKNIHTQFDSATHTRDNPQRWRRRER